MFVSGLLLVWGFAVQNGVSGNAAPPLFSGSDQCMSCHNGLITPTGADVSIGSDWRASMMAHASRDPYWHAGVRRELMDHPGAQAEIENECAICHMPMAAFQSRAAGGKAVVFANLAAAGQALPAAALALDGASCTVCHQISQEGLGTPESFTGGFKIAPLATAAAGKAFGPYEVDRGRTTVMRSATDFAPTQSAHITESELCATCHTLFTHALDKEGKVIGTLPEQVPYLEWRHSGYRSTRSCQSCHMPKIEKMPIASVLSQERPQLSQHVFRAANFLMPQIFARYAADAAGTPALTRELNIATAQTLEHLKTSAARVTIANPQISSGRLTAEVVVRNNAGHKLPTAYPSRRVWIHFTVRDAQGNTLFESGAFQPNGSIAGNDNDSDAAKYEPHYAEIDHPDKVQIYESIMLDSAGSVTTGLLTGVRYGKDNRVLPMGFDKKSAGNDIAVCGQARDDGDFAAGGDRVRYSVELKRAAGPYTIQAELWYQPIGFRWAQNLRQQRSIETDRFVSMFESMAQTSAAMLAQASATVQ